MKNINLSFTEEQFDSLQKMLFLGKWMLESHHDDFESRFKVEQEVEQIICVNSSINVSEFSKKFTMFFPTKLFEDEMHVLIEDYDEYTFWEELGNRLAKRDMELELGDKLEKMELMEKISKHDEYLEIYKEEFYKNELKNLVIK